MKLEPLLYVTDLRASVEFYWHLLQFKFGEYYPDPLHPTYASIMIGVQKLRLVQDGRRIPSFHKHGPCGSGVQLYVQIPNVDDMYNRIKGKVQIAEEIEDKAWGDREFTICDPDGYLISFYAYY
jgi:uncharacterized glyoxalase superfamily protein PhnB